MKEKFFIRTSNFFISFVFASALFANDLSIDRHSIRENESVTITVSLEDEFAAIDDVSVPVRNLVIGSAPSVSSEFSYINGTIVRRKVFRFRARPVTAGAAVVGPLHLAAGTARETLPAVSLQVVADAGSVSNDPAVVLRELIATDRDPLFVVAELDKKSAFVGEQVVVTWWLYNGASVNQWQIGSIPKLDDFWVEELDVRNTQPVNVYVGSYMMQKLPIRRVALFPLHAGTVEIGPMQIEAALMRRTSFGGIFDRYEGSLAEIDYTSARLTLDVKPLPPGAAPGAVGDLELRCNPPFQKNGGPVVLDAVLSGRGNVRAASQPKFVRAPDAEVQVVDSGVTVAKRDTPSMTRRWRFLLAPRQGGTLSVPPLELPIFSPASQSAHTLRCDGSSLAVVPAAEEERTAAGSPSNDPLPRSPVLRLSITALLAIVVAATLSLVVWPWWKKRRVMREELRRLTADPAPAAIRDAVHARLEGKGLMPADLLREPSIRGEAYRSLRSLLDALERDRIEVDDREREIRRRLRDLLLA